MFVVYGVVCVVVVVVVYVVYVVVYVVVLAYSGSQTIKQPSTSHKTTVLKSLIGAVSTHYRFGTKMVFFHTILIICGHKYSPCTSVGWFGWFGWLVGRLVGWLVGWLTG